MKNKMLCLLIVLIASCFTYNVYTADIDKSKQQEAINERLKKLVRDKNWNEIKGIVERYPNVVNEWRNFLGTTLLGNAVLNNNFEMVRFLVEDYDADVNLQQSLCRPILIYIADIPGDVDPEIVQYLIDHGAKKNAIHIYGKTAADYAKENKKEKLLEVLEGAQFTKSARKK
jgi:ankyrin repeat protein